MKYKCPTCKNLDELKLEEKVFSNGTKHISASCSNCGRWIKFIGYDNNPKMYFGKHKGKTLEEIKNEDKEYLEWILIQAWTKRRLKEQIKNIL